MNLEELKQNIANIRELRELLDGVGNKPTDDGTFFEIGENYLIRTVTMIVAGKVIAVNASELKLSDAAWIADTGRFSDALRTCQFNEVEPFHSDVIVGRGGLIDATQIDVLPRETK
jgi:hypothetical protein